MKGKFLAEAQRSRRVGVAIHRTSAVPAPLRETSFICKQLHNRANGVAMISRIYALGAITAGLLIAGSAVACPFCSVESQTLSEEIKGADAAVLAKLVKEAPATANPSD